VTLAQTESAADVNTRTAQLVRLIGELGPDIPEISRRLGQFKESVRYRYKEKVLGRGFTVQAAVDHEKLGLRRLILVVAFAEEYEKHAQSILAALNQHCYLVSYARTLPEGQYVVNLSVPRDFSDDVRSFFDLMKEKGMFTSVEAFEFDWLRRVPMKPESYDFDTGRWDFDFSDTTPDFNSAAYSPSGAKKFDYVDLLIIKELQKDANKSMKQISDTLKLNYKKLSWHFATHVAQRRLIGGYSVNWMGTGYDYKIEKVLHRKHRYFALDLLVKDVNPYEAMMLRQRMDKLPFLWAEAAGKDYFAEFAFPLDYIIEGLQYLGTSISEIKPRTQIHAMDQTNALSFSIPYALYDADKRNWVLDKPGLIQRFDELLLKIRRGAG